MSSDATQSALNSVPSSAFHKAVEEAARRKIKMAMKAGIIRVHNPAAKEFTPRMDLIDDPSSSKMIAMFEVPGIKTADISLHIRDGNLMILGQRRCPMNAVIPSALGLAGVHAGMKTVHNSMEQSTDGQVIRQVHELRYGPFSRTIKVPVGIQESDITASLQDGMLSITWPKSAGKTTAPMTPPKDAVTPPQSFVATSAAATAQ